MKVLMIAMQFGSLATKLLASETGKKIIDTFLDAVEDNYHEGGRTHSICQTIRLILNVPDVD